MRTMFSWRLLRPLERSHLSIKMASVAGSVCQGSGATFGRRYQRIAHKVNAQRCHCQPCGLFPTISLP